MLNFYEIDGKYLDYLRKFDDKIPYIDTNQYKTYKNTKFFCGIVLSINGMSYYTPVSSYNKTNVTTFGIFDKQSINPNTNKPKQISSLRLGFMFPCPINYLSTKHFSNETYQNKIFLQKELFFLNNKITDVYKKAEKVYKLGTKTYTRNLYNICNFPLLEEKCKEWNIVQNLLPTLKNIKNEDDLFYIFDNLNDKNNFDKLANLIDNNYSFFNKNIKLLDIKDLENKRFISIDELAVYIDLKGKELFKDEVQMTIPDISMLIKDELPFIEETKDCFDGEKITKLLTEEEINNIKDHLMGYFSFDEEEENYIKNIDITLEKINDFLDYIKKQTVEEINELSDNSKIDDMVDLVVSSELDKFKLTTSLNLEDIALAINIKVVNKDNLWNEIKEKLYDKAVEEIKSEIENNNQTEENEDKRKTEEDEFEEE